jgi:prepilin-type N-terminal cleavage/methylation domain-containing protein
MLIKQKRRMPGFTLVELIVVIGIIAVLAAVMIPLFSSTDNESILAHSRAKTMFFRVQEAVSDAVFVALQSDGDKVGGMKPLQNFLKESQLTVTVDGSGQISGLTWSNGSASIPLDPLNDTADKDAIEASERNCLLIGDANKATREKAYVCIIYKKLIANFTQDSTEGHYLVDFDEKGRPEQAQWSKDSSFGTGIDGLYDGSVV